MDVTVTQDKHAASFKTTLPSGRNASVDVFHFQRFGSDSEEWTVNWSALGSVSPEDAAAYAELLHEAAEFAAARAQAAEAGS